MLQRPQQSEYNAYYEKYINLVPDGDLLDDLKGQLEEAKDLLGNVSGDKAEFRYDTGKWSLKEVVGHIADTERVMSYRLLVVARGDTASLPSFDENLYVSGADFNRLNLQELLTNLSAVRQSTCSLITSISDAAWMRTGTVSEHPTTARAIAYIIAGHALHHLGIIKERYLSV